MKPDINLNDYTIMDCTIKVHPTFVGVDPLKKPWDYKYKWDYDIRQSKINKSQYRLNLNFVFEPDKKNKFPFYLSLKLIGILEYTPTGKNVDEKQIIPMVTLNGLAILYGVMRSLVSEITSQCYHGRFILPTVNFVEEIKKKHK